MMLRIPVFYFVIMAIFSKGEVYVCPLLVRIGFAVNPASRLYITRLRLAR